MPLKKVIRQAKTAYFAPTFNRCKHDTRETWQTINEVISKSAKTNNFPTHFTDGNKTFHDNQDIANRFNAFFTNVGPNQANATYNVNNDHLTYMKAPNKIFTFENVLEEQIVNLINELPSKQSCGCDGLTSKILKLIKGTLTKSLTLLTNQIINTGVFPKKLKEVKVECPTVWSTQRQIRPFCHMY